MIDINDVAETISNIKKNNNSLDILLEFEAILDNLHVYAYENWEKGEIIKGPIVSKYWVEVFLMYPKKHMPNPDGALRLTKHGCYVFFQEDMLASSVKIQRSTDLIADPKEPNKRKPKHEDVPVYVVKVVIPRHLLSDYSVRKMNALDGDINLDEIIDAYDQGLDVSRTARSEDENENDQQET